VNDAFSKLNMKQKYQICNTPTGLKEGFGCGAGLKQGVYCSWCKLQHMEKKTQLHFRHNELKSKALPVDQNEQCTGSKNLEADGGGFCHSAKPLTIFALFFGFAMLLSWYLDIPVRMQGHLDRIPMQFNIVLGLLVVMGVLFVLLAGGAFKLWQNSKSLRKNLEDEISQRKKAEKNLSRAQKISKTGNWVLELSGREMRWSSEVYRILGCSPKNTAMKFQIFLKSVHPDDRGFVDKEIQKAMSHGTAFNLTHRIVHRDGSIRMVKQRSEIYLDQKGKPAQILGTLQDITDQKEAENMATRLGRIVDKTFSEVYFFDAETLKFSKVNLAARLNLRYNMEEFYEMTPVDLLPGFTWEKFQKLVASLKRGIESVTAFETVHKRKNGTLYPIDIRLQLSRTETRPQFVAIVQDITDRKKVENLFSRAHQGLDKRVHERTSDLTKLNKDLQMEIETQQKAIEALGVSEHRLIEIINNVVDGIITIDEEGTIHSFNRAAEQLFGFKIEEALGQNIDILMTGSDDARRDEYFQNLLQSKKSAALGLRRMITARKKDGTLFTAELGVHETVIRGQRMFTGLIRNLTEKKEIEHELMQILKPLTNS
jgi:PAS domain S-box-containing protein